MPESSTSQSVDWLQRPQWFFIGSSVLAAIVAIAADGPDSVFSLGLVFVCVVSVSAWSLSGTPPLHLTVALISLALLFLGWTAREPESALFQAIIISTAVGWRVNTLSHSLFLLFILVLVPPLGSAWQTDSQWGWWNWSAGTAFSWTLGRVIRLLDLSIQELHSVRSKLIESAAKEERLRISRDVHDLVGHSLTAMLLNIRAAQHSLGTNVTEAKEALDDAHRIGRSGISDIRATLVNLRSEPPLHENADSEALSSLPDGEAVVKLLAEQDQIEVNTTGNVAALKGPLAVALYRISQECITNMSKYAAPGTATITLSANESHVMLYAENELATEQTMTVSFSEKTLGLISMRERVNSLRGTFSAGVEGKHWKIMCTLPNHD